MGKLLKVYTDGGSRGNPGLAGAGVYIEDELGQEFYHEAKFLGNKTNNEAEYLALLTALDFLLRFEQKNPGQITAAHFFLDSKLVVEQLQKHWKINKNELRQLAELAWKTLSLLPYPSSFKHVLRHKNAQADELANQAMDQAC